MNNDYFDMKGWHDLANNVGEEMLEHGYSIQCIVPFGFEVLGKLSFLTKKLKRFYCYLGGEHPLQEKNKIETLFKKLLFKKLLTSEILTAKDIVVTRTSNHQELHKDYNYSPKDTDKFIEIEYRYCTNILNDYSAYIIACIAGISESSLRELKEFQDSQVSRNRIFQLYLMLNCIFSEFLPPLDKKQEALTVKAIHFNNSLNSFFANYTEPKISREEIQILNELIMPRINYLNKLFSSSPEQESHTIQVAAYHDTSMMLQCKLPRDLYHKAKNIIIQTYNQFISHSIIETETIL